MYIKNNLFKKFEYSKGFSLNHSLTLFFFIHFLNICILKNYIKIAHLVRLRLNV